jgi:hypothetical protein
MLPAASKSQGCIPRWNILLDHCESAAAFVASRPMAHAEMNLSLLLAAIAPLDRDSLALAK